ncbi:MAG: hypothetical protein ABI778_04365 [Ignavibacteriota bacterium]
METKFKDIERLLPRIGLSYRIIADRLDLSHTTVRRILMQIPGQYYSKDTRKAVIKEVMKGVDDTLKLLNKLKMAEAL